MATTQTALAIMAAIGTISSIGIFVNFDRATRLLVAVIATIVWASFGLASFDVIVRDNYAATASEPIPGLAYMGLGLAVVTALFALMQFFKLIQDETGATEAGGFDVR